MRGRLNGRVSKPPQIKQRKKGLARLRTGTAQDALLKAGAEVLAVPPTDNSAATPEATSLVSESSPRDSARPPVEAPTGLAAVFRGSAASIQDRRPSHHADPALRARQRLPGPVRGPGNRALPIHGCRHPAEGADDALRGARRGAGGGFFHLRRLPHGSGRRGQSRSRRAPQALAWTVLLRLRAALVHPQRAPVSGSLHVSRIRDTLAAQHPLLSLHGNAHRRGHADQLDQHIRCLTHRARQPRDHRQLGHDRCPLRHGRLSHRRAREDRRRRDHRPQGHDHGRRRDRREGQGLCRTRSSFPARRSPRESMGRRSRARSASTSARKPLKTDLRSPFPDSLEFQSRP